MAKYFLFLLFSLISFKSFCACELYDLEVSQSDCNKEKNYYLTFNFKYKNVGECFTIKGNGKNYGSFKYHQLPVTIGPFLGDCKTKYEFVIQDCKHSTCKLFTHYGVVCCETSCEFSELHLEKTECNAEGKFCVILNFSRQGHSKCFSVSGNGKEYGKFSYSQLPLKICGLDGDCDTNYEFTVRDCENHECTTSNELGIICCEKACKLTDLKLEKTDCDESANFYVFLNFKHENTSSCFKIKVNGKLFGTYNYSQLPVKIGPFHGDCKTNYVFTVVDCEDEHCTLTKELGKVCCEKKHCELKELKITKTDCDPLNEFYVFIDFKYSNTSPCFMVKGNGTNYGTFNYSSLPIKLGPFKGDCKKHYEFIIIDCENEHCKISKSIGKVCCDYKKDEEDFLRKENNIEILSYDKPEPVYIIPNSLIQNVLQFSDKISIRLNVLSEVKATVHVYNSFGIPLQSIPLYDDKLTYLEVNTDNLLPGVYILQIKQAKKESFKFIKF